MKILWLAHEKNLSGANICLIEYVQIMKKAGAENFMIVPSAGDMEKKSRETLSDVAEIKFYNWMWPVNEIIPFKQRLRRWMRNKKAVKDISLFINTYKPDYVVTNTVTTPVAARAAKKMQTKHIWFIHEFGEEDHGYTLAGSFSRAASIINDLSYKVVFNSKAIQKKYESFVPPDKREIVYNAVAIPPAQISIATDSGKFKIAMLGQINPSKNQLDALKALKGFIDSGFDAELNIAGKAEGDIYLNVLKDYIFANNLQNNVNFCGIVEPEKFLSEHELLLMCSRMEAFGRVTIEALKHGIPVIAANTGGSLELINNNVNGYLYQEGNHQDLTAKIICYAQNKNVFNRPAIASQALENYNLENTKNQLIQVFS